MVKEELGRAGARSGLFDVAPEVTGGAGTPPSMEGGANVVDAHLLFSGDYGREGQDLLISGEGASVRVPGYFATATPADLVSPDGAVLRGDTVELLAGPRAPGQYAQAGGPGGAGDAVGHVGQITGSATVQHADGTSEQLGANTQIFQGDVIQTDAGGTVGILFNDNTVLLVEPGSRLVVNQFVYDPGSNSNHGVIDAVDGTFAFVAGKMAHTGGLDVTTPIATMGIRGTTGLCVTLESASGRCSLGPDPDFQIGRIDIIDRATGALFTTLTQTDVKISLQSGQLNLTPKSDQEIVFDEQLVQQLHQLYGALGVPQLGPLQKANYDGGDHDFSVPIPGIGRFGGGTALALLPGTDLDSHTNTIQRSVDAKVGDPIAGSTTVGNLNESMLDTGTTPLTGVLQFSFDENKPVHFDFASLDGRPVLDSDGRHVTASGVPLVFSWDSHTHTLSALAGGLVIFTIELDPDTGAYKATLFNALDHPIAGVADLLTIGFTYTITVEDGRTAHGVLSVRFADDVPTISIGHSSAQTTESHATSGSWSVVPGADGLAALMVSTSGNGGHAIAALGKLVAKGALVVTAEGVSKSLSLSDIHNQVSLKLAEGTLVVRADGTWTFTANHNLDNRVAQDVTFKLTVVDGDGDPATATAHISISDGAAPTASGEILVLTVEERALDANDVRPGDDIGSQPQLTTEIDSGQVFFTAGSDDLIAFVLDASKIVVRNELGEVIPVTWIGTGTGHLIGQVNGLDAIRIDVGHSLIQAFETGSVTVAAHLLDNFHHAADGSGTIQVTGVEVVAKDIDGSAARSGVSISITDDSASISLGDLPTSVEEGKTVGGQYHLVPGADGVKEITVSVSFGDQKKVLDLGNPNNSVTFTTPEGVLEVLANGTWTFTAANNLDNERSSIQFTLTVRDGDDDTDAVTASQSIKVVDGTIAPVGHDFPTISVKEADPLNASSSGHSTASFTAGSDSLTHFALDSSAISIAGIAGTVTWLGDGTGQLVGRIGGVDVIRLTLTAGTISALSSGNATVTAELLGAFPHAPGNGAVTISGIHVVASEADGDSASPANVSVTIGDDVPTASAEASQNVAEGTSVNGTLDFVGGADGATVTAINGIALVFGADGFSQAIDIGAGVIRVKADGTYSFSADAAVDNSHGPVPVNATYTVTDGDGDTATSTIAFKVTDAHVPVSGTATATVDDDGLAGGSPVSTTGDINANIGDLDGPGSSEASFSGVLGGSVGGDLPGTFSFAALNGTTGTVGQETVSYSWNALTDTLTATGPRGALFAVHVTDAATGAYHVTLLDNVLHAQGPNDENNAIVNLGYVITDADGSTAPGTLTITFNDDAPVAAPIVKTIADQDTNVLLILDRSGSMGSDPGVPGFATRLDLLKAAANDLLDKYDALGDVRVQIIEFNDNAQKLSSTWMTVAQAKAAISGLTASGGTDYDDATALAPDAFDDPGKLTTSGAHNVAYFISDGQPQPLSEAVTGTELTNWINFVNTNHIVSHAIGIGSSATDTYLDPIAYDGSGSGTDTDAVIVTDLSQLQSTLVGTIHTPVSGSIIDSSIPTGFGADGGYVRSIAVGGSIYTYDSSTHSLSVTGTNNGAFDSATHQLTIAFPGSTGESFAIDLDDGHYVYTAPNFLNSDFGRVFNYTLADNDGDTAASTLTIKADSATNSNSTIFNIAAFDEPGGANQSSVVGDHLLIASPGKDTLEGGSGIDTASYSTSTAALGINLDDAGNATTDSSGGKPSDGEVAGDALGDRLSGIENLVGGSGDDYLAGNSSDNTLIGNAGNDTLNGEGGNDTLDGGSGLNTLSGGSGSDTFVIDPSALTEGLSLVDIIADFSPAEDVLDLSKLMASLGIGNEGAADAAVSISSSGGAAHVFVGAHEVAALAGVAGGSAISVLYDHNQPTYHEHVG
jgi:von Willebrand factor type A domain/RTX calcium-binding nonapeptide repeat (4 copies)/FecR protein